MVSCRSKRTKYAVLVLSAVSIQKRLKEDLEIVALLMKQFLAITFAV